MATLECRKGVQRSCFIVRRVFLSTLALEKTISSGRCVVLIGLRHKKTADTNIIAGRRFCDLSNVGRVFDKLTRAISHKNSVS